MPPRFTYWTIVLDGSPTAFRASRREDLLPTLKQLQGKNPRAELKWFARGRVWESPEEARAGRERGGGRTPGGAGRDDRRSGSEGAGQPAGERRGKGWRPGGEHRDPHEKFKKETYQARKRREKKAAALARQGRPRPDRPREERPRQEHRPHEGHGPAKPWQRDRPRDERPREGRPPGKPWQPDRPRDERPREGRPPGKPWQPDRPRDERPREGRPPGKPWRPDRPRDERPREGRPP
ncbi:MAG: hypothetical protein H6Q10_1516, partial [Acidobacteria bacterium]|nr:hypothetical protein [Acidobacteriota bacterium]